MKKVLNDIYSSLYRHFGPQNWWPGDSPFEVIVGAILTQNTAWTNVEKAVTNLKKAGVLSPAKMLALSNSKLSSLIKPSGFYNVKTSRLKTFLKIFKKKYNFSIKIMERHNLSELRKELLDIKGIGRETADSIILYAVKKPIFVIDAYTKRMLTRFSLIEDDQNYANVQKLFMDNLESNTALFNEYHALIIKLAKDFCKARRPFCEKCPLRQSCKKRGL
ncbi:MAG: endonuclease III domain-containing protein [Candidatus Omnitrophica bacterium]|nr:endonuclease III domain-containing protein [Candidatus Omnitrophota bacterium]